MALKRLTKFELAFLAGIILIIPFIIVFQLSKADINIGDFTSPIQDTDPFANMCIEGDFRCIYLQSDNKLGEIIFTETETRWQIAGDNVWCVKFKPTASEPIADPIGSIGESQPSIICNNLAIFDKSEWNLTIFHADTLDGFFNTFTFTMK